jgi:PAS domain-containing protein
VYCSPQFCALTGYEEHEVLGRNCRFLQAPGGLVQKGEERRFTDDVAVAQLRKSLVANKECQASIVNYKKDKQAFINMLTVIPIFEGDGDGQRDVIYHVGFQVDLTRQPGVILEKVRNGSYAMDFALRGPTPMVQLTYPTTDGLRQGQKSEHRKTTAAIPPPAMSKDLKKLLADPAFVRSFPITTCTTVPLPLSSSSSLSLEDTQLGSNSLLSLILLEASPDFIHVVSLKGTFLYVSPSVRRVLGYEPSELVGGSISDFTHPEDVVPLMRELKESSATAVNINSISAGGGIIADTTSGSGAAAQAIPRSVDLLFRARTKAGVYVWVECRGRLHVEPGKGRKAIILSGRAKEMTKLSWGDMIRWGGGLTKKLSAPLNGEVTKELAFEEVEYTQDFWGMMHGESFTVHGMTFLSAAVDVRHILGWTSAEMVGMNLGDILVDGDVERVEQELAARGICLSRIGSRYQQQYRHQHSGTVKAVNLQCQMKRKDGTLIQVELTIYRSPRDPLVDALPTTTTKNTISPSPLVYRIKLVDPSAYLQSSSSSATPLSSSNDLNLVHPLEENIFQDLETSRNSSWQYELQQLRFANQRLEEEIKTLEGTIAAQEKAKAGDKPQSQAKQNTSRKVGTQQQRRDSRGKEYHQQPSVDHQEHHIRDYATMRPLQPHTPQRPRTPGPYDLSSSHPHPHAMAYSNVQAPIPAMSSVPLEWSSPPLPLYIPNGGQSRQDERTNHRLRTTATGAIKRSWHSLAQ